eukprot:CAMPEP_0180677470 /NCGR_PEP_ID=MMETSP1037_2-20121125/67864_1 /TAXON_ID=632150 /ORGANISM="Azadinium spinosum, Strain 3D9" /LENGTH=43 /DNA_ID= /DNA_START= /DNA_END= /DNA_ORIENTATION=
MHEEIVRGVALEAASLVGAANGIRNDLHAQGFEHLGHPLVAEP